jgi:hypothetical protein
MAEIPLAKDAGRRHRTVGAGTVPAGEASSASLPGGFGSKRPAGTEPAIGPATSGRTRWTGPRPRLRKRRLSKNKGALHWRWQGAGNARSSVAPSQEVRELKLSGGVRSLPQVPRWNAERRARPKRAVRASGLIRGARRARSVSGRQRPFTWRGHQRMRFSAFRFLYFFLSAFSLSRLRERVGVRVTGR